jgi:hypothetical protein
VLRIEMSLLLLAIVIAFACPSLGATWFERLGRGFTSLGRRRGLSVAFIGFASLGLRLALLPILPVPEPIVHDEFGYLLAADTFCHGRLANPTHPMWMHFETFHAIFHPTYASIYPPAPGLLLAAGRMLTGNSFWGVWLSVGLMCAAITWMLQAWLNAEWALLGGVIAILRYGVFGYWANSYWGGTVGAIGGALVLGALPRIQESQRPRDALVMGIGLAILANSRPYEGFVFALPVAVTLFAWMLGKNSPSFRASTRRVLLPLALMLAVTATGMGYYFWRVTGNPFRMPYQIERETYAIAPYMFWQPVRPEPAYHHSVMRQMFVEKEMLARNVFNSPTGFLLRIYLFWIFFLGPALTFPLLMLVMALPRGFSLRDVNRSTVVLLAVLGTSALGAVLVNFYTPHYSSPDTGIIVALVLISMRQLRRWGPSGLFLARAIPLICALSLALRAAAAPLHIPLEEFYQFAWHQKGPRSFGRAAIQNELQRMPGKQLVIVHYKPDHEPFAEWVYNDADIDGAKVVWAREMDPAEDQKLLDYFKDRQVWLLEADEKPPRLSPYSPRTNH